MTNTPAGFVGHRRKLDQSLPRTDLGLVTKHGRRQAVFLEQTVELGPVTVGDPGGIRDTAIR